MKKLKHLITQAFSKHNNDTFIIDNGNSYSYKSSFDVIRNLSILLQSESGFNRESNTSVAILCDNKKDGLFSILACALLETAYIPLDNLAPSQRNLNIVKDNQIPFIIISKSYMDEESIWSKFEKIELPQINSFLLILNSTDTLTVSDKTAYILFTSGSTGSPKGIEITHTNALSFINWAYDLIVDSAQPIFCSVAPFQFDLSVFDIYVSILSGGQLVLFENEDVRNPRLMTQMIDDLGVQIIYTTPTVYNLMWTYGKMKKRSLTSLECLIFAGEVMTFSALNEMKAKCPSARYFNFYGPTETNVCTYFDATHVRHDKPGNVPIGVCCPYAKHKVLNLEPDSKGELIISSDTVFLGYINDDNLTNAKIIFESGESWYHTGDIVYEDESGQLNFVSRIDRMIKLKGYRIELDEIESVLNTIEYIQNSAVLLKNINIEDQIIAYVEMSDNDPSFSELDVKDYCQNELPHYMIPNSIILIDEIPINSNAKVDYNKLMQW